MNTKWEYKSERMFGNAPTLEMKLDNEGKKGWEAFHMERGEQDMYTVWFKRQVQSS